MQIDSTLNPSSLASALPRLFELSTAKATQLEKVWDRSRGTPVFTVRGKYTTRGWTEWTEGFLYGIPLLTFDVTGETRMLNIGRAKTAAFMAAHVTHHGVHDHGFNNLSTYGNLRRLMREGRIEHNPWELAFYELAIKSSACAQAVRWSKTAESSGYIYSFNGPHSLFIDTMRTLRILGISAQLGHVLQAENDVRISLLGRVLAHGTTTARYSIYYGEGRDYYDTSALAGRTAHEAIFNTNDGRFRCPGSQQGYGPFSTWTRGLAWAILGFAEQLEFLREIRTDQRLEHESAEVVNAIPVFEKAAMATAEFYISQAAAADGICYWDTGAPGMVHLADFKSRAADPFNDYEPVDASASAIAAQGLLRLGEYLSSVVGKSAAAARFSHAGLTIARTLLSDAYLATAPEHEGLLMHSVYHRPNGWDHIPAGRKVPCGESSLWGDYHLVELGLYLHRLISGGPYYQFFDAPVKAPVKTGA